MTFCDPFDVEVIAECVDRVPIAVERYVAPLRPPVARQVDGDDATNRRKGCTLKQPILGASAKTMDKQQCLSRSFERITQCSTIMPKAVHYLAFSIAGPTFQSPSFD